MRENENNREGEKGEGRESGEDTLKRVEIRLKRDLKK